MAFSDLFPSGRERNQMNPGDRALLDKAVHLTRNLADYEFTGREIPRDTITQGISVTGKNSANGDQITLSQITIMGRSRYTLRVNSDQGELELVDDHGGEKSPNARKLVKNIVGRVR